MRVILQHVALALQASANMHINFFIWTRIVGWRGISDLLGSQSSSHIFFAQQYVKNYCIKVNERRCEGLGLILQGFQSKYMCALILQRPWRCKAYLYLFNIFCCLWMMVQKDKDPLAKIWFDCWWAHVNKPYHKHFNLKVNI